MVQTHIPIWEQTHFPYDHTDGFNPTLDTCLLDSARPRGVALICPGGGCAARGGTAGG